MNAVLFDLDGTLAATAGEIAQALNATLAEWGRPPLPQPQVEALIGRGIRSLVERAVREPNAQEAARAVERFELHYRAAVATKATLFPGVQAGLERLRAAGIALGVVTNKSRSFTEKLLAQLGVADFFTVVVAGDDGIPRKPRGDMLVAACARLASEPRATLMIGDSDNDVLAARAAGCPIWCVPGGYNEGRPAETLQCDRLVASVEEAAALILGETT